MTLPPASSDSFFRWLPAAASDNAGSVDLLFIGLLLLSGVLVALLVGLNLVFLIRYRRGSPAPRPPLRLASWKLEATWITATTIVFLGIFAFGAPLYVSEQRPPPGAYEIHVTGRQWMWDIRQPNGRREFDTLHIPLGRPIRLVMESEDVIHSFYVPAFRLKQDLVPGKQVSLWFQADRVGTFHLFCAEYCGTKHSAMTGSVIVQSPADYAAWLEGGSPGTELLSRGRLLFTRHGCSGCHDPNSRIHAPLLQGLYGRRVPLADGSFVTADDRYLRDSILQPQREVAAGYEPVMPGYEGQITAGDLLDIIAYLKSLRAAPPPAPAPQPVLLPTP